MELLITIISSDKRTRPLNNKNDEFASLNENLYRSHFLFLKAKKKESTRKENFAEHFLGIRYCDQRFIKVRMERFSDAREIPEL